MPRKQKKRRKQNHSAKSNAALAQKTNALSELPLSPLEKLLGIAAVETNAFLALEMFQSALDECQGVAAASSFENDDASRLWELRDGRSYLRALFGVASSLWRLNRVEQAATLFEELLQADPDDHQSVRYWLAVCWLDSGKLDEVKPLLDRYDDPAAIWRFVQALAAFATGGDSDDARRLLNEAHKLDRRFVEYLLGDALVQTEEPVRFDSRNKASHSTARLLLPAWRSVPGATAWVRRTLRLPLAKPQSALPFPRQQLLDLPREETTWQVGLHKMKPQESSAEEPCWVMGIADAEHEQLRLVTVIEGNPTPHAAWQGLLAALLQPLDGQPQRPARIEVPQPEYRRVWGRLLDQLEIDCQMKYQPQPVSRLLEGMAGVVEAQRVTGLDEDFDARDLPQSEAVWQVDFFHQPTVLTNAKVGTVRPWSVLVMDKASRRTLINETFVDQPGAEQLWECAARVMQKTSQRPRRIEVSDADGFDVLRPELERADVECVMLDELPELHAFCLYMAASYGGPEKCALADGRDVDRDGMEAFYYAAAQYYRRKPWKYLSLDAPVEIDAAGGPTRYVQVLGRSGVTLGMTVYERQHDLVNMMQGAAGWDSISGCSVIFDEEAILAPADLYLVERHGWPIATPEAYPAAMRFRPGYEPGSPSASELTFLTACLHCLPDFVACAAEEKTYRQSDGGPPLEMRLRWSPGFATPSQRRARPLAEPLTKGNA